VTSRASPPRLAALLTQPPTERRVPWIALAWLTLILIGGLVSAGAAVNLASHSLTPPSLAHPLGTDLLGRDVGLRLLAGGLRTLRMAAAATVIAAALGSLWGLVAGHAGGWLEWILVHANDVLLSVPGLVLALVVIAALGQHETTIILAVGVGGVGSFARLARSAASQTSHRSFVLAARALGASEVRLLQRHVFPNTLEALTAYALLHFGWALVNSASLTFLGLGGAPSIPDWGQMLNESRLVFLHAPWLAAAPGTALALTVLAVQRLGEWIAKP
jgi:peptide/nickel transport system permease protein